MALGSSFNLFFFFFFLVKWSSAAQSVDACDWEKNSSTYLGLNELMKYLSNPALNDKSEERLFEFSIQEILGREMAISAWWPKKLMGMHEQEQFALLLQKCQAGEKIQYQDLQAFDPGFLAVVVFDLGMHGNHELAFQISEEIMRSSTFDHISLYLVLEWAFFRCSVASCTCQSSAEILDFFHQLPLLKDEGSLDKLQFYLHLYLSGLYEKQIPVQTDLADIHLQKAMEVAILNDMILPKEDFEFTVSLDDERHQDGWLRSDATAIALYPPFHLSSGTLERFFSYCHYSSRQNNFTITKTLSGTTPENPLALHIQSTTTAATIVVEHSDNLAPRMGKALLLGQIETSPQRASAAQLASLLKYDEKEKGWKRLSVASSVGENSGHLLDPKNSTEYCMNTLTHCKLDREKCLPYMAWHEYELPCIKPLFITGTAASGTMFTANLLNNWNLTMRNGQPFQAVHERWWAEPHHQVLVSWWNRCEYYMYTTTGYSSFVETVVKEPDLADWEYPNLCLYDNLFHQVRHPLRNIESIIAMLQQMPNESQEDVAALVQHWSWPRVPPLATSRAYKAARGRHGSSLRSKRVEWAALYWLTWNRASEAAADFTYRIEDANWTNIICRDGSWLPDPTSCSALPVPDQTELLQTSGGGRQSAYRNPQSHGGEMIKAVTWDELRILSPALEAQVWTLAQHYGYERDPPPRNKA